MDNFPEILKRADPKEIAVFLKQHGLHIELNDGKYEIVPDEDQVSYVKGQIAFWDSRQQTRKILLNSLYGALLNEALRFSDERMGQSVTLTGRSIVRHMNAEVNRTFTGEYDFLGETLVYADTDSCYFTAAHLVSPDTTREQFIELYDAAADAVNATFPEFMHKTFNTSLERGAIIAAGRELVASRALFIKKKKYGALIYDLEGTRLDQGNSPGKLKAMGLDLKRADTPQFMQEFLQELLLSILTGSEPTELIQRIKTFRHEFKKFPAWQKGSPKKVSNLSKYRGMIENSQRMGLTDKRRKGDTAKNRVPGHVLASLNWNQMCNDHKDKFAMRITDGTRIIVCKLKPNMMRMDSIAYPIDELQLPQWFKELPFDDMGMEEVIIDKKINNLVGVLNWPLEDTKIAGGEEFFVF
jgi:hypothetical protein